jgi:hypothetical protein
MGGLTLEGRSPNVNGRPSAIPLKSGTAAMRRGDWRSTGGAIKTAGARSRLAVRDREPGLEVPRHRLRKCGRRVPIMTLSILQAAEARVELDAVTAAVVRARNLLAAEAPGHAVATIRRRFDIRQIPAQLGGEAPAPGVEVEALPRRGNRGSRDRFLIVLR